MPKTKTPDQLRAEAEALAIKAAEAQAEVDRITLEEYEREQAELAEQDQQTIANYNRAALDQAVEDARAEFQQALADLPVTQALAGYVAAGYRRSWAHADWAAARGRLGMPEGGNPPHPAYVQPWAEAIEQAATRIAQAQIDSERGQA